MSGSFQAFDQRYLLNALQTLGDGFVGITQLPASVSDEQLLELQRAGVRGLRFNARRGGSEDLQQLDRLARRVHERVGWHVELYIDASELTPWSSLLTALPAVSVDHLELSKRGLLTLAELGVRVKATGFGRVDFDVRQALRDLYAANPDALMFGTDLPSTRAPSPYSDGDFLLVLETLGEAAARKALCDNALAFYRMQTQSRPLPDRDQTTSATVEPTLTSNIELKLLERSQ